MIITRLMGGLGNQMFQYAVGRRLSLERNVPLKLDRSYLDAPAPPDVTPRSYELGHLRISASFASPEEVRALGTPGRRSRLRRAIDLFTPASMRHHWIERMASFDPAVLHTGRRALLEGYWQSPRYFEPIRAVLLQDFRPLEPATGLNLSLLDKISQTNAVALHVRRGDYVSSPSASRIHGICGLEYYAKARRVIESVISSPHFFIFSDDPDWVVANFHLGMENVTIVGDHNARAAHEDLRLMSACRHFIIANSSFSWWGAWLGTAPGKVVVAPSKWNRVENGKAASRHPSDWIVV